MAKICLGRHVFGLAAVVFGVITLVWGDFNSWQQIRPLGNVPHRELLVYIVAIIEIIGGIAIQWSRTARAGAYALGSIYLIFALLWVPHIVAEPRVFDRWGNFFEQFSLVSGALITCGFCQTQFGTIGGCPDWIFLFRNLRSFIHGRTTPLPFRDRLLRSQMDSSRTNVLGDNNHDCVCACGHRSAFRTCSPPGISLAYCDDHRLRSTGMAAHAFRRST